MLMRTCCSKMTRDNSIRWRCIQSTWYERLQTLAPPCVPTRTDTKPHISTIPFVTGALSAFHTHHDSSILCHFLWIMCSYVFAEKLMLHSSITPFSLVPPKGNFSILTHWRQPPPETAWSFSFLSGMTSNIANYLKGILRSQRCKTDNFRNMIRVWRTSTEIRVSWKHEPRDH